ncbi:MAG: hypothetical protein ACI9XC_000741 [Gammaproteobacteria bacterium]|jgi:hypothetical protein
MMIFKKTLPRRTFLRGMGAAISLPMVSAMIPALAAPTESKIPLRTGYIYSPNGIIRETWRPATRGKNFEMTEVMKNWENVRDKILVLSNMNNGESESVDGHVGGSSMFLTGIEPKKSLSELHLGISVDQYIAQKTGKETPLASLQVCIENAAELAGQSNAGYNSAYTNTISWSSPTTPIPMEHRPREIFERLFGDGGTDPVARKSRIGRQKSILDFVREDTSRVKRNLGMADNHKLDEFTDALRGVEQRVQMAEQKSDIELPEMQRPVGIPVHEEHIGLMYDLLFLAFQTDTTRVFSFMVAREYSEMVYTHLGHTDPYHPLTHHRGDPTRKRQASEIDVYHAKLFGNFLTKMEEAKDADGSSLLDNSMIVYGAGMGEGDVHNQYNVPIALIGGGGGNLKSGRNIEYTMGTPLTNLHLSMLDIYGIPLEKMGTRFGESTGRLDLSATS